MSRRRLLVLTAAAATAGSVLATGTASAAPDPTAAPTVGIVRTSGKVRYDRASITARRTTGGTCTASNAGFIATNGTAVAQTIRTSAGRAFLKVPAHGRSLICGSYSSPFSATFSLASNPQAQLVVHFS